MEISTILYSLVTGVLAALSITTLYFFIIFFLHKPNLLPAAGQSPDNNDIENQRWINFEFHKGKGEDMGGGEEDQMCAVCLSEFDDGESIGLLPECKHCFHVQCIDMWLQSHSNCPLCRARTTTITGGNKKVKGRSADDMWPEEGGSSGTDGGRTATWFWWVGVEDTVF